MIDKDDRLIAERYSSRGKLITEAEDPYIAGKGWPKFGRFPGDDPGDDTVAAGRPDSNQWPSYTNRGTELHIGAYTPERSKEFGQYFYDVLRANSTTVSDEAIHAHVDNWIADQLARRNPPIDPTNPPPEWATTIESIKGLVPAAMMDAREEDPTTEMYSEAIPPPAPHAEAMIREAEYTPPGWLPGTNVPHPDRPAPVQRGAWDVRGNVQPAIGKTMGDTVAKKIDTNTPEGASQYIAAWIYASTDDAANTGEPPHKTSTEGLFAAVEELFDRFNAEQVKWIRDQLSSLRFASKFGDSTRNLLVTRIDDITKEKYPQTSMVGDLKSVELGDIPKDVDYSGMEQDTTTNKKFKEFFLEYEADFGKDPTPAADFGKAPTPQGAPPPVARAPGPVGNLKSALMAAKPGDSFSMIEVGDALWPDDTITNRHAIELRLYRPMKIGSIFKDIAFRAKHFDFDTMGGRTGAPQGGGGWDEFIKELESQVGGTWMTDYGIDQKNPEGLGGPGHNFQFGDDVPGIVKLGWNPLKWPENYSKEIDKMGMTPEMKWLPQVKVWKVDDDNRTPGTVGMMGTFSHADPIGYWKKKLATATIGGTDYGRRSQPRQGRLVLLMLIVQQILQIDRKVVNT